MIALVRSQPTAMVAISQYHNPLMVMPQMAKDIFAIQISSVGPERIFSTARYCGGYTRARLSAESLKQIVFCRYAQRVRYLEVTNLTSHDIYQVDDELSTDEDDDTMETSEPLPEQSISSAASSREPVVAESSRQWSNVKEADTNVHSQ